MEEEGYRQIGRSSSAPLHSNHLVRARSVDARTASVYGMRAAGDVILDPRFSALYLQ